MDAGKWAEWPLRVVDAETFGDFRSDARELAYMIAHRMPEKLPYLPCVVYAIVFADEPGAKNIELWDEFIEISSGVALQQLILRVARRVVSERSDWTHVHWEINFLRKVVGPYNNLEWTPCSEWITIKGE
jgi:hypothetical protein